MTGSAGSEIVGTVSHMKKKGTLWVVIFGLIAGLILLIMGGGGFFSGDGDGGDEEVDDSEVVDAFEYKSYLEGEIREVCRNLCGTSEVYVCVRVGGSGERVYAKDKQYSSGGEREEYVIIGSGSNAKPLYLGESLPEILGIGVVIKGNNLAGKKSSLEAMLSSAYGVPQNRVWVEIN